MSRFIFLFFVVCCYLNPIQVAAQKSSGKHKKPESKTISNDKEEKIEEIIEDVAISTKKVDTTGNGNYRVSLPVKKYDTTLAPNDALTAELTQLVDETQMLDITTKAAQQMLSKSQEQNNSPEMKEFFTRFSNFLGSKDVKDFYRNLFIKIYRKYYTLEETKELRKFYQTALGKKSLRLMNTVMEEAMAEGRYFGEYWGERIFIEIHNEK